VLKLAIDDELVPAVRATLRRGPRAELLDLGPINTFCGRVDVMKTAVRSLAMVLVLAATVGVGAPHFAGAQDKKDKDKGKAPAAGAVFELYKDSAGEFRFRLKDEEGALLATSGKGYKAKADCQKVIEAIRRDAAKAKVDDMAK
jgi:uncharacterized protein YegP (UPF0339 family)